MSIRNLDRLLAPRSVAVIGASERPGAIGQVVTQNIIAGGFAGPLMLVNPGHKELFGRPVHADVASLPQTPDLAVVTTPADSAVEVIAALAARGTPAAIVIAAGFSGSAAGAERRARMLAAAKPALLRVMGPNCVGLLAPGAKLNASFAHVQAAAGGIGFVTQSGAMLTAVLDWAVPRGIGFSVMASLGDMADVDFGDMLDYLANDRATRAILLYIEGITHARKFMSAARAAARSKPVIVVKTGRHAAGARAAASHTGALAGADAVYDAAFRRAGMLRVLTLEALFDAAQTLALARPPHGERLAILTNGGGVGVLATDAVIDAGGTLAALSPLTMAALDGVLPATWSRGNPIDIIGDAGATRYTAAFEAVLAAPEIDAVLVLNCPTAVTTPEAAAKAVIAACPTPLPKTVLTSWVGGASAQSGRALLREHGLPTYDAPEDAVRAFMQMVDYRRNQAALLETPPSLPNEFSPDSNAAREVVKGALAAGREWLDAEEVARLLDAYGIERPPTRIAATPAAAAAAARELGVPVALKIRSHVITHKSDVGGVVLGLAADDVEAAAEAMLARVRIRMPDAVLEGFLVQAMVERPAAWELIAGVVDDHEFGPILLFGEGGVAVELINDKALALPPLNMKLAQDTIARTRIARRLAGFRNVPAVNMNALALTLVRLSQLVVDLPEVRELDLNPLLSDHEGVIALDARVKVAPVGEGEGEHDRDRLAIRPYPKELEEIIHTDDGRELLLRPILPEDELPLRANFERLTPEEVRFRFFVPMKMMDHVTAARFSQIDYDRQMALVLTTQGIPGATEIYGIVRLNEDPDRERGEYAILIEHSLTGLGLGTHLMKRIISYAKNRGLKEIHGDVLTDNHRMRTLCRECGFRESHHAEEPGVMRVTLDLSAP